MRPTIATISSDQWCSVRKGALRNVAKFPGKLLCRSLFFNKVETHMQTHALILYTCILTHQGPMFPSCRKHSIDYFVINLTGFSMMEMFKDDKMYTVIRWYFSSYLTNCISFKIQIHLDYGWNLTISNLLIYSVSL